MTGSEKEKRVNIGAILLTIIPAYAFADEESLKEQMKRLGIENDDWIEWEPENIDALCDAS